MKQIWYHCKYLKVFLKALAREMWSLHILQLRIADATHTINFNLRVFFLGHGHGFGLFLFGFAVWVEWGAIHVVVADAESLLDTSILFCRGLSNLMCFSRSEKRHHKVILSYIWSDWDSNTPRCAVLKDQDDVVKTCTNFIFYNSLIGIHKTCCETQMLQSS